ncbi:MULTISPECIES: hypothetical protein [unclassified Streptomyces]|uniref:hypothetical protein n=1 Tax=unclassified Streptomyces TaxID=2593676 RepID=UPI00278C3368|nr:MULTISPECIES: hypothetical protein [unclassified Streptomyces]
MYAPRVNAAKFISRYLGEPHETDLGGEEAHELLATAHADICCPPSGHRISWADVYGSADMLPLTWKADMFVDFRGEPHPLPSHLTEVQRERAVRAQKLAVWIRSEAQRRNIC